MHFSAEQTLEPDSRFVTMRAGFSVQKWESPRKEKRQLEN